MIVLVKDKGKYFFSLWHCFIYGNLDIFLVFHFFLGTTTMVDTHSLEGAL